MSLWKFLFLFSLLAVSVNSTPKIVGGRPTTIEEHPYQLALEYFGYQRCGASLISNKYAITAAHCTVGLPDYTLSIRGATTLRNEDGRVVGINKVINHPNYDNDTVDNDIAILELSLPFNYSAQVQPIKLVDDGVDSTGQIATVTGWGFLREWGGLPTELQELDVPILSKEVCKQYYKGMTDNMICAGYARGKKDACTLDSGGPLVVGDQLVGIVSWGEGCARPKKPGIYTKVANYREFIRKYTNI